jgi:hypothetical protein
VIVVALKELNFPGYGVRLVPGEHEIQEPISQGLRATLERHARAGNLRILLTPQAKPAPVPTVQVSIAGVVCEDTATEETVVTEPPKHKRSRRPNKP